jgi:flagellar biosynthesis/type III secretory pathway M-ring protein FliF/YscJ
MRMKISCLKEVRTMNATTILCILLLSFYLVLAVFWIVRSIIDTIDDRKREKRNAAWEAERQQLEKDRALREVEYHEARMKELDRK